MDPDKGKRLAFNFTDPCQELTRYLLQTMLGFDNADQEEELLRPFISADRASCSWFLGPGCVSTASDDYEC